MKQALVVILLTILLRLPFLNEAVQGDDVYYLYGAQHAQVEPLHPLHTHFAFMGQMVDMRGHPHGPLNSWILGGLVALFGEVREVPFHSAYIVFSLMASLAMLSLARRFCPGRELFATLLFLAVPAFVVNGNSLETDLPFLAFWLISFVYFAKALDTQSVSLLWVSCAAGALAALDAYQAGMLTPILALYLWPRRRTWTPAWIAILAAPATIVLWQAWEWWTSGVLPAAVLIGYMRSAALQSSANKLGSGISLFGHAGWIVFPALTVLAFGKTAGLWRWAAVAIATLAGLVYDPNPLFWISLGTGVLLVTSVMKKEFLSAWAVLFFAASLVLFFAGSARYLLPIAAPVAILVAQAVSPRWLIAGIAAQFAVSLGLAAANHQHWAATRNFADAAMKQANGRRVWVNAELGLRHYLEDRGARPLLRDTVLRADDIVVTSALVMPVTVNAPMARMMEAIVSPSVPLRLISIEGGSGYSASSKGWLPFEISTEVVDRLTADVVTERRPELSYLDPKDPKAASHVIAGLFPDGWMSQAASLLLKIPASLKSLDVEFFIPPDAPARRVTLLADGKVIAENTYEKPGAYHLTAPFKTDAAQVTVGLQVDATHTVPPDSRALGMIVTGVGFH
ncbi:MAG: glycosyltransferase family 39 protein [Bryobacteraceae bacterium]